MASASNGGRSPVGVTVGAIAFGITVIAAVAAISARETYRVNINDLGNPNAVPMGKAEYEKKRTEAAIAA